MFFVDRDHVVCVRLRFLTENRKMGKRKRQDDADDHDKKKRKKNFKIISHDLVPVIASFCEIALQVKMSTICRSWKKQIFKHVVHPKMFSVFQSITPDYFYEQGTPVTESPRQMEALAGQTIYVLAYSDEHAAFELLANASKYSNVFKFYNGSIAERFQFIEELIRTNNYTWMEDTEQCTDEISESQLPGNLPQVQAKRTQPWYFYLKRTGNPGLHEDHYYRTEFHIEEAKFCVHVPASMQQYSKADVELAMEFA